jgi:Uma2 family endonuclease
MGLIEPPELLQRHRLTVDEYHRMAEAGVLAPDARVELIEGEIIDMAPIGTRHGSAVLRLNHLLNLACGRQAVVSVQAPLRLSNRSEPEPDLMLLRPRADYYAAAHPGAGDVLLLIEVSDSTARYDREIKLPLYARHGVAEVWIVDLDAGVLRCFSRPQDGAYADSTETRTPGSLTPLALSGVAIDMDGVLG